MDIGIQKDGIRHQEIPLQEVEPSKELPTQWLINGDNNKQTRGVSKMKKKKDDWFDEHFIVMGENPKQSKMLKEKVKESLLKKFGKFERNDKNR